MEYHRDNYGPKGRKSGNAPKPKPVKHLVRDEDHGIKFEVFALRELTENEVDAEIRSWMGRRTIKDLTPWRTYRIQTDIE